jgi:hypothetical protein
MTRSVSVDRRRIERVTVNFLQNAIKYADRGRAQFAVGDDVRREIPSAMVRRAVFLLVVLATGCSYRERALVPDADPSQPPPDADRDTPDADPAAPDAGLFDVAHVRAVEEAGFAGIADVTLGPTTIDTSSLTVSPGLPGGTRFYAAPQDAPASPPEIAILEVRSLTVNGVVTVRGTRPLVIIAATTIAVGADLDATARQDVPGPGGAGPSGGTGAGTGGSANGSCDDGGAGGAFGDTGGTGGFGCGDIPTSGPSYGTDTLVVLEGGSGGGTGSQCSVGGAGGGAIQLSAGTSIDVAAMIAAGGGGGGAGHACSSTVWSAGAGGGSGGAIYLQAPVITGTGPLAANGGGGGGGSSNPNVGTAGNDATGSGAAGGGPPAFPAGGGGDGAARDALPQPGEDDAGGNAGGGGGGVGRIVLAVPGASTITVTSSPAYVRVP